MRRHGFPVDRWVGTASTPFVLIAQGLTVTSLIDHAGSTTGTVAVGGATDDVRPAFNGTLAANVIVNTTLAQVQNGAVVAVENKALADADAAGGSVLVRAMNRPILANGALVM